MKDTTRKIIRSALGAVGYDVKKLRRKGKRDISEEIRSAQARRGSRKRYNKIFCIGHNKTGTTSLNEVFKIYGLNVPDQGKQERMTTPSVFARDYSKLRKFVQKYDAFQDLPFSEGLTYVACDALFPNSKFILTVRSDDAWYKSLYNFHRKGFSFESKDHIDEAFFRDKNLYLEKNYVYEWKKRFLTHARDLKACTDWSLLYDEEYYKEAYNRRNAEIIKYFAGREDDLLVIDVTEEKDTSRICDFLGIDRSRIVPMPHKNKT